jgi:hypothetical protein
MSKAPSLCSVRGCRKPAAQRGQCYAHIKQDYAKRHPLRYCYNSLKQNAKRRGKAFELTFEQFEEFATRTDYINKRGTGAHGFTIDRIDPTKGYTAENIQVPKTCASTPALIPTGTVSKCSSPPSLSRPPPSRRITTLSDYGQLLRSAY